MKFIIIQTTFPQEKFAKKLSKILLEKKLAACVNFQKISSQYIWQNKIENGKEILLNIKTLAKNFSKIEQIILQNHPYEIPEIIAIEVKKISQNYQSWIEKNSRKT